AYIKLNSTYHGYEGISQVIDIDIIGRILEFNIPVEAGKQYTFFYNSITDYRLRNGDPHPFRFIDTYDSKIYGDSKKMMEMKAFNSTVIKANIPEYVMKAVTFIPRNYLEVHPSLVVNPADRGLLSYLFYLIERVYFVTWFVLGLPILFISPLFAFVYMKKPTKEHAGLALFGGILLYQVLLTTLIVYGVSHEYPRLMAPMHTLAYMIVALGISKRKKIRIYLKKLRG
ncbi:hypothetical protein ACFL1P_01745, partial [Patescibacteria group bacterium]